MFLLIAFTGFSQTKETKPKTYIQFSGRVVDQDSMQAIPFVSIMVNDKGRAIGDYDGFFTVVVSPGDILKFMTVTHKTRSYKVDDTCALKHYWIIQALTRDTLDLPTVDVYPWPSKEDFKRDFLALNLNATDYDRADNNLNQAALSYMERNMVISGSEAYKNTMNGYYNKVYTKGQQPQMPIMNPIAWAQFIDSWRKKGKTSSKTRVINKLNED